MQPEGQAPAATPDYLCWLASFPRSGNTWVRNIFYEVFGLKSAEWGFNAKGDVLNPDCFSKPVVKTHLLPRQLIHDGADKKAVYLVRDGRDAMVSIAHHRSDIVAPGSDLIGNMRAAILAEKGSFFGGWSVNVEQWLARADLIVRYEDLLENPQRTMERVRQFLGLPEADYDRMPRFEVMKAGLPQYGAGDPRKPEAERRDLARKFFRRGTSGAWREDMPPDLHDLFWSIHGDTMLKMGYRYQGDMETTPDPDLDWEVALFTGQPPVPTAERVQVTIQADKIFSGVNDSVKRSQILMLKELAHVQRNPGARWNFRLFANGRSIPLAEAWAGLAGGSIATDERNGETVGGAASATAIPLETQRALRRQLPEDPGFIRRLSRLFRQTAHRVKTAFRPDQAGTEPGNQLIHLPLQDHYAPFADAGAPVVVTIHDVSQLLRPPSPAGADAGKTPKGWEFALRKAASLIVSSEAAAVDLRRLAGQQGPPTFVIPGATDRARFHLKVNSHDRRAVRRKYGIPHHKPFFLTCSTPEQGSNRETVVAAFLELLGRHPEADIMLVAGGSGPSEIPEPCGHDPRVIRYTGFIREQDLPFLLTEALAFCQASHGGPGMPLLEALNCGTPVICGNDGSIAEMVGDAGLTASASDPREISLQMEKLLNDEALLQSLRHAALRQAARFSSREMAGQIIGCYLDALNRCRGT